MEVGVEGVGVLVLVVGVLVLVVGEEVVCLVLHH